jgi:hypothetical protein
MVGIVACLDIQPPPFFSAHHQDQSTMATTPEAFDATTQQQQLTLRTIPGDNTAPAHENTSTMVNSPVEDSTTSKHTVTQHWTQLHKLLGRFNKYFLNILIDVLNGKYESFTSLAPHQKAGIRAVVREAHLHAVAMMRHQVEILALVPDRNKNKKHWNDTTEEMDRWLNELLIDKTRSGGEEFPVKCVWALMVLKVRIEGVALMLRVEHELELSKELMEMMESAKSFIDIIVAVLPPDALPEIEYQ